MVRGSIQPSSDDRGAIQARYEHDKTPIEMLWAGARLRCPICWEGRMFRGPLKMAERCDHCGWRFDRGNGYFVGAMYVSYWISVGFGLLVTAGLYATGLSWLWVAPLAVLAITLWGPLVAFPYSRLVWIWAEQRTLHHGEEDDARNRYEMMVRAGKRPFRVVPTPSEGDPQQQADVGVETHPKT